jgi:hypothetical protein
MLSEADYERAPVGPEIKIEIPEKKKKVKKVPRVDILEPIILPLETWDYAKHWVELERELVDLVFGGHYSDALPPTGDAAAIDRVDDIDVEDVEEAWESKFGDQFPAEEEKLIAFLEREESRNKSSVTTTWTLQQIQDIVQNNLSENKIRITPGQLRRLIQEELQLLTEELHPKVKELIDVLGGEDAFKKKAPGMDPDTISKALEAGSMSEDSIDAMIDAHQGIEDKIEKMKQDLLAKAKQDVEDLEA